ncbi:methyl-accepting chemotaxis protein [Desulfuribacillus alkaliarsenatis]|uniref:Chemotaxis protein n=1 Tax=Desulfuribacillus alkaliarsenatis TaxID=766136 RepID=A0A1E5FZ23_9FIRM|nr:methyl-accepting chemotaxis protein [Desulfuribacillus alkaliarsenatis]OEF95823.1 hypothetical protein BHF68_10520 [Desulfuribacillus alkaliarsenatis]
MFKSMKLTIKTKLITLFVLVGLIPALVIGLFSLNEARTNIQDEVFKQSQMFSEFITEILDDYFEARNANALALSNSMQIYQGLQVLTDNDFDFNNAQWQGYLSEIEALMEQTRQDFDYELMYITDSDGVIVYSSEPAFFGLNLSDRGYVQDAFRGQQSWSDYAYSDLINKTFMATAAPIHSRANGELLGAVAVVVEGEVVGDMIHSFLPLYGETADAYMFNADGLLLTNTMFGEYSQNAILNATINTEAVQLATPQIRSGNLGFGLGMEYLDYEGTPVIGALDVVLLGDTPVGFVAEIYQSEAYAGIVAMQRFIYIILGITIPLVLVLGLVIATSLAKPIIRMQEVLSFVGNNDLRVHAEVTTNDEIGMMAEDLNTTIDKLNMSLNQVKRTVDNVNHGAEEIAAGNQDLSQRTEEQASALEEIASTVEEITSSMEASSANAVEADNLSRRTLETVQNGEQVVNNLQESMTEITKGSREISEIISTVNDIAFQTNLLALNAAVEAARAGEQGRGFAVVAAEVRNLAGRSAEAAKEIEMLIKSSIERVDRGNQQMDETQQVLHAIVDNTRKTTDVVGEIAASLKEQTVAATDIRRAIDELNQVTQQNASLVEEIASSSENMSSEAMELSKLVSMFKLSNDVASSEFRQLPSAPTSKQKQYQKQTKKQAHTPNQKLIASDNKKQKQSMDTDDFDFDEKDFEKF